MSTSATLLPCPASLAEGTPTDTELRTLRDLLVVRRARIVTGSVVTSAYLMIALVMAADMLHLRQPVDLAWWLALPALPALSSPLVYAIARWVIAARTPRIGSSADWLALRAHAVEQRSTAASLLLAALALPSTGATFLLVPLLSIVLGLLVWVGAWIQPVLWVHAVVTARRWARQSSEELAAPRWPVGPLLLVLLVAVSVWPLTVLCGEDAACWSAVGAGLQVVTMLVGQLRVRRRLLRERQVITEQLERAR